MKKRPVIKVRNVTKHFKIPIEPTDRLKHKVTGIFSSQKGYREFTPLRNINFEINEGDFFGIVGRNGSGKSTLLKTIAGIYTPNKGSVKVDGVLVPFIELGVGFNPELSGRENVFLNGALLGFSREEMAEMYDDIVDFAEIGDFMDQKLKNYSSGMQVRLAFSIAIRARGDILLLDEVLAVGDEAFQRKCYRYFAQLKRDKKTVVLVTHDMSAIQKFCTKALFINNGKIEHIGDIGEAARLYRRANESEVTTEKSSSGRGAEYQTGIAKFVTPKGQITSKITDQKTIDVLATLEFLEDFEEEVVVGLTLEEGDGRVVYDITNETLENPLPKKFKKGEKLDIRFQIQNVFPENVYYADLGVADRYRTKSLARIDNAYKIDVQPVDMKRAALIRPYTEQAYDRKKP